MQQLLFLTKHISMKQKFVVFLVLGSFLFSGGLIFAKPNFAPVTVAPSGGHAFVVIPEHAVQIADNVFDLGVQIDKATSMPVRGYAVVHYKERAVKNGKAKTASSTCYGYLANGAKWKIVEPWQVNPSRTTLDGTAVFSVLTNGVQKWEDATDGIVNNGTGVDILGAGQLTNEDLLSQVGTLNSKNEVYFAALDDPNVIAVTYVWGYFYGVPKYRQLVEWDQVYNTAFPWSLEGAVGAMDFDNIATHELGHAVGMADLYNSVCSGETMYGYATYGETKKRDLNAGDIEGVNKLY